MTSDRFSITKQTIKKHYILILCFSIAFIVRLFLAALGGSRHWDFRDLTATGRLLLEGKMPYRDIEIGKADNPPLISYTMMVTVFFGLISRTPPHDLFDLLFKPGTGHHHPPPTGGAYCANVGAQSHHTPLVPTARMGLTQAHDVV